ncbi:MAG: hypothetical protein RBR47_03765, partial [Bacteroidales bacterium]|nr:hypothetical protein [Bacteroidales bacterium]
SGYKKVFEELLFMHPEDSEISIVVAHQKDDYDGEEYVNVSGKYANPKSEEEEFSQAIEFTPWNKWLGMEISQESLQHFSELEIISHCLYEMTFVGFEEEEIQKELNSLEKSIEEYKNMTDEEKKANTISLEELLKDLENDETEEN